ncbi:hypothetical protein ElyMa_001514400 [Elysia marginata]|uniref:Uncharacterized protein n=1 Tax=Elysia marginata TaxID=1093978 RepID=A0AAV4J5U9_9GAST|nr:hypothetical protein ElyMa_001514400 [Elysia marginata]
MYRRSALSSGLSPSEILNGRQIRSLIGILNRSVVLTAQGRQSEATNGSELSSSSSPTALTLRDYRISTPVYTAYFGPMNNKFHVGFQLGRRRTGRVLQHE